VSFTVPDGSLTAVIGPNGAGKTTVFNLVTNLYAADQGEVTFYGTSLLGLTSTRIAALGLIRTFQTARIYPGMTALENVLAGAHLRVRAHPWTQMFWLGFARREERALTQKADALLELVGLAPFRDIAATDLPMGGQKQLEVVRALMAEPKLLLLDEPAAGLNTIEKQNLRDLLKRIAATGLTILIIDHDMSLIADVADRITVLNFGQRIADGAVAEVLGHPDVIAAYLGAEVDAPAGA
jgi:branched-chain amino acid transport system ATP-binding protein